MKIDIHTHTRKCKSGDAPTREISPESLRDAILSTEVRIIAITNHNVFDLRQYTNITTSLGGDVQVWPGIELDIREEDSNGHLLVIVSPIRVDGFSEAVRKFTEGHTPDSFTATIDEVLEAFDSFKPIYVAHYKQKKPNLSDDTLDKLLSMTKNPSNVINEVTNSISAGIYISHGHASIYGSDVQNWANYEEQSLELPDLRLPVDSFEHFCLLLQKDPNTIDTVLNRKTSEELELRPFADESILRVRVFDDINVVFGSKGTGKTCILKAIARHYSDNGIDAAVYESASDRLDEIFDTKGRDLTINLDEHGIHYCTNEIKDLRTAKEVGITSLGKYVAFFTAKSTNRNAKKMLLKDIEPEVESEAVQEFEDFADARSTTKEFIEFLVANPSMRKELSEDEHKKVTGILSELLERLKDREWSSFSHWKEICFLNSAIEAIRLEVERKTGSPAKPTTTGLLKFARNRMQIEKNAAAIVNSVDTKIPLIKEAVGDLGSKKGELEFQTVFKFQTGAVTDSSLSSLSKAKKTTQKKFMSTVREIQGRAYAADLFQHIADLNEIQDVEGIKSVHELLLFRRCFTLNGVRYLPSSGESSMVMLQKELGEDKDIYILDEPERSLGNEYISDVIVPLIKERARTGKKILISTHDANIAVRTLPYNSIYRRHGKEGYSTYVGNPFSNNLVNPLEPDDKLDWKKISMRTLEGGVEAFGERGQIYGNN